MNMFFKSIFALTIFFLALLPGCKNQPATKMEQIREQFKNPPLDRRPVVYWFWNGNIGYDQIRWQLEEMRRSNTVSAVVVMAWEGLTTEYLSKEWFDKVRYACQIAEPLELDIWLYDEQRWPSGHAGGKVLDGNPEYQGKCLSRTEMRIAGPRTMILETQPNLVAAIAWQTEKGEMLEETVLALTALKQNGRICWEVPAGEWIVNLFETEPCDFKTTFTDLNYVDLLDRRVVQKFISLTYDAYYQSLPEYFGTVIKAIITDEPGIYCDLKPFSLNPGTIPWTSAFAREFLAQKGYDLTLHLPALWQNFGPKTGRIRIDFYEVVANLLQRNYFEILNEWCTKHHIQLNIQPSHEETLKYAVKLMGDYYRSMEYSHLPGIDEVYSWDKNIIVPKIGSSAARAFGSQNVYAEVFGAYGCDLTLEKMKAVTDWLYSRGINHLLLSSFYFAMDGAWRFEIPPSLFYQNPFWKYLPNYTDYVSRLTYLLSAGRHVSSIAVLYPTRTAQALMTPDDESSIDSLDTALQSVSTLLLQNQLDFDYMDETTFLTKIKISTERERGVLRLETPSFSNDYEILILPAATVMEKEVITKLQIFKESGGKIIAYGRLPTKTPDGESLEREIKEIFKPTIPPQKGQTEKLLVTDLTQLLKMIRMMITADFELRGHRSSISYIHKVKDELDIYFISNSDSVHLSDQAAFGVQGQPQIWNPETGYIQQAKVFRIEGNQTIMPIQLEHYGSLLILFDRREVYKGPVIDSNMNLEHINLSGDSIIVQAHSENIGTDYLKMSWNGCDYSFRSDSGTVEFIELPEFWQFSLSDSLIPNSFRKNGSWTKEQTIKTNQDVFKTAAYPYFSGTAQYRQIFEIDSSFFSDGVKYILDGGRVKNIMEVWLNGQYAGERCWLPYTIDITQFLKVGQNELVILVSNTMANHYESLHKQYITTEHWGKILDSGLLDRLKIYAYKIQKISFAKISESLP